MGFRGRSDRPHAPALLGFVCGAVGLLFVACVAPATVAAVPADSVGVYSEELERANSAYPVSEGRAQRDAGAGIVRQTFSWARIETVPGSVNFAVYDHVMAAASLAGVAVLPVIMDPPPWRSTAPATGALDDMYPPREPAAMAVLAGLLVQRYGPGGKFWAEHPELPATPVRSWQIWNEPNTPNFWAPAPDPAAYADLLRTVAATIRAADPTAEVVSAGLPESDRGVPLTTFLDAMYDAGARGSFDTLAVHPYASDAAGAMSILRAARAEADRRGDAGRPIWATEFGWATGGPPVTISASEADHATLLKETVVLMQQARSALTLRGFIVFRWRDVALNAGQSDMWPFHAGLLRKDGSPKPALRAFTDAAAVWRQEPAAPPAAPAAPPTAGQSLPAQVGDPPSVAGVEGRVLRIARRLSRGRLSVSVAVPPGGGGRPVEVSYEAVRGQYVVVRRKRSVSVRNGVARVVFALPRSARAASYLRITAKQGTTRATRVLKLRSKPRV
jgi:hypothetical protein